MNWLNLKTTQLREPAFIGSDPVSRATWLCVMTYCVELENGGRISGARLWKDRQWQQTCGVMLSEVQSATSLLTWDGDDLLVWNYPAEKEAEVRTRRETAQQNGKRGGRPPKHVSTETETHEEPTLVSKNNQRCKAEGEGEGERKENGNVPPKPPTDASASPSLRHGRKKIERIPTTSHAIRIAQLFSRKLTTAWSEKEVRRFKSIGQIDEEDIGLLERYYAAERKKGEEGIHRRDLLTFLNNWTGELDRARAAFAKAKPGKALEWAADKIVAMPRPSPEEIERGLAEFRRFKQEARP